MTVLRMSMLAIILLTRMMLAECMRVQRHTGEDQIRFEEQTQIAGRGNEDTKRVVFEEKTSITFEARGTATADGTEAFFSADLDSSLFQRTVSQGTVQDAKTHLPYVSGTLGCVKNAGVATRLTILKAACDSKAFSCEEIIHLANISYHLPPGRHWTGHVAGRLPLGFSSHWAEVVELFAAGRGNRGCISDPDNGTCIVEEFKKMWPATSGVVADGLAELERVFINNEGLTPAKSVPAPPTRPQTSHRTDEAMKKLLTDMKDLDIVKAYGVTSPARTLLYVPGSPAAQEFERWVQHMRAGGDQFSGPQLVALVYAIPKAPILGSNSNLATAQAVSILLQYLEQYVTEVTCAEVQEIVQKMDGGIDFWLPGRDELKFRIFSAGFNALKSNIIDGQNKMDIVASTRLRDLDLNLHLTEKTEELLQDVGGGLPSENNPIFGVVKGNPVIFVVDESTSMDAQFAVGNDTFTRREFCHGQLDTALERLPNGSYFNVIHYSSVAIKIFREPVLVSKRNIHAATQALSGTWRADYTPGQDAAEMLRNIEAFALFFERRLTPSTKKQSLQALQLAYGMANTAVQHTDDNQQAPAQHPYHLTATKGLPQIYFLTSGQSDGTEGEILKWIGEFDSGRNIPVNSIVFVTPFDVVTAQFVKDLAKMTSGFLRSFEQG